MNEENVFRLKSEWDTCRALTVKRLFRPIESLIYVILLAVMFLNQPFFPIVSVKDKSLTNDMIHFEKINYHIGQFHTPFCLCVFFSRLLRVKCFKLQKCHQSEGERKIDFIEELELMAELENNFKSVLNKMYVHTCNARLQLFMWSLVLALIVDV